MLPRQLRRFHHMASAAAQHAGCRITPAAGRKAEEETMMIRRNSDGTVV
eukprot:COSAG06_NODE_6732_length_2805_cov_1.423873_1_plen_48_part_10